MRAIKNCVKQQQNLEQRFSPSKMYLIPEVATAAVCPKVVVLLLLIHSFLLLTLFVGVLCLFLILLCSA